MLPDGLVHLVGKRLKCERIVICRVVSVKVGNDQHLRCVNSSRLPTQSAQECASPGHECPCHSYD